MNARTATHSVFVLVALAVALAVGALLGALATSTGADAVQPPAVEQPTVDYSYGDPFLTALAPNSGFTPAEVERLVTAADRVCEGFLAGVPYVQIADGVAASVGVDDTEARRFAAIAASTHCAP